MKSSKNDCNSDGQYRYKLQWIGQPAIRESKGDILLNSDTTRFGRHSENDCCFDSVEYVCLISRWHAEIQCKQTGSSVKFFIADKSLNGTYVNDIRVKGSQVLQDGDVITFGCVMGHTIQPGECIKREGVSEFQVVFERDYASDNHNPSAIVNNAAILRPTAVQTYSKPSSTSPISESTLADSLTETNPNVTRLCIRPLSPITGENAVSLKDITNSKKRDFSENTVSDFSPNQIHTKNGVCKDGILSTNTISNSTERKETLLKRSIVSDVSLSDDSSTSLDWATQSRVPTQGDHCRKRKLTSESRESKSGGGQKKTKKKKVPTATLR